MMVLGIEIRSVYWKNYPHLLFATFFLVIVFALLWFYADGGSNLHIRNLTAISLKVMISLLIFAFILLFPWALFLYFSLKGEVIFDFTQSQPRSHHEEDRYFQFRERAHQHEQWSQLWFTISLCILFGGLIFVLSEILWNIIDTSPQTKTIIIDKVIEAIASHGLVDKGIINVLIDRSMISLIWSEVATDLIANFFVFSLFYVAWNWSVRHFRAHWHNSILNAYRFRALWVLHNMIDEVMAFNPIDMDRLGELRKLSALLLLSTEPSAYLDTNPDLTLLERIAKLEDMMRNRLTGVKEP